MINETGLKTYQEIAWRKGYDAASKATMERAMELFSQSSMMGTSLGTEQMDGYAKVMRNWSKTLSNYATTKRSPYN